MLQRQGRIKQGASAGRAGWKADTEGRVWRETWAGIGSARMGVIGMSKIARSKRLRLENWVFRPKREVLLISPYPCFLLVQYIPSHPTSHSYI